MSFLASLRPKRFAEQNLGAGGIQFRRAREIRKGSRKIEDFVGMRRESGVPSVLRSKTLAQAEFSFAEQEKSERVPAKSKILWGCAGSPASQAFCRAKPWRRRNSVSPSKRNQKGFPQNRRFCGDAPGVRRPKRFAEQNLGAGGIQFRRAREIRKGSRKIEDFVGKFDPDRKGDLSGSVRKMKNDLGGSCQYKKREMRRGEEWIIPQTSGHHRWEPARWTCQQSVPVRLPAHGERPWRAPRDADKPVPVPVRFQWCRTHRKR